MKSFITLGPGLLLERASIMHFLVINLHTYFLKKLLSKKKNLGSPYGGRVKPTASIYSQFHSASVFRS